MKNTVLFLYLFSLEISKFAHAQFCVFKYAFKLMHSSLNGIIKLKGYHNTFNFLESLFHVAFGIGSFVMLFILLPSLVGITVRKVRLVNIVKAHRTTLKMSV